MDEITTRSAAPDEKIVREDIGPLQSGVFQPMTQEHQLLPKPVQLSYGSVYCTQPNTVAQPVK